MVIFTRSISGMLSIVQMSSKFSLSKPDLILDQKCLPTHILDTGEHQTSVKIYIYIYFFDEMIVLQQHSGQTQRLDIK